MMPLLQAASTQLQIWTAYTRLDSADPAERQRAAETLQRIGPAALTCLRFASSPSHSHRARCTAAVALHGLKDQAGLKVLAEALMALPLNAPDMTADIQSAYNSIGAPDAVTALIEMFPRLDERDTHIIGCVCAIWATLRDPRALPVLTARGLAFPQLFEQTVPAFGEMAVIHLERMARDPIAARRLLAISALSHITTAHSFAVLRNLLRDRNPEVRRRVPEALRSISPPAAAQAIEEAIREGFSTREAVDVLAQTPGRVNLVFFDLVRRWEPGRSMPTGDTPDAVLAALPHLKLLPIAPAELMTPLCDLLKRETDPAIASAAARLIAACVPTSPTCDQMARDALVMRLPSAETQVRDTIAAALSLLGDPIGAQLLQRLQDVWPQESWLARIQTILRGGPEAGQVATQAVQQVSQWFTRVSREAVERLGSNANGETSTSAPDPRLSDLLSELLHNALNALDRAETASDTAAMLALCVAAIRALGRIGVPNALAAHHELVRALHMVKLSSATELSGYMGRPSDRRDVAGDVRLGAAIFLQQCYGSESLSLFLEVLRAPQPQVRRTAIEALGRLGDPRALAHLHPIAADNAHPDSAAAHDAILAIRHLNPEVMTLLRASAAEDKDPDSLLRPASGNNDSVHADLLLRPAADKAVAMPNLSSEDSTLQREGLPTRP